MYIIIDTLKVRNLMNQRLVCAEMLADKSSVTQSTIAHILARGKFARVQDDNLKAISEALGVEPQYFTADLIEIEKRIEVIKAELTRLERTGNEKKYNKCARELAYIESLL